MFRKRRIWYWIRILLRWLISIACVVWLLSAAGRLALVLPLLWTAFWIHTIIRASRKVRRDADSAGTSLRRKREMPRPVFVVVAILAIFLMFGWALVVALAWGALAGIASLFLELVIAKVTIRTTEFLIDYNEIMEDFTPPRDEEPVSGKPTKRFGTFAIRPLPRNVQVISLLVLSIVIWAIIIKSTQWLPWIDVGLIAAVLIVRCLAKVFRATPG